MSTNFQRAALLLAACTTILSAEAQVKLPVKELTVPRFDFSLGYNNIRANAPPGGCQCFEANGGFLSGSVHLNDWFSVAGEFTGNRSTNLSQLRQNLTLTTFTIGPRVTYRVHRLSPFGQILVGGSHGSDSYFPSATSFSTSATSFAFSTGGGLDVRLTQHFWARAAEVQYLQTGFPNGGDNIQHHLMLGAGLVYTFSGHRHQAVRPVERPVEPPTPVPAPPPPSMAFTCGTNVANVPVGQMVAIFGNAKTDPADQEVAYSWTSESATVEGSGSTVSVNTTGMPVGDYRVKGVATLVASPATTAECVAVFRVVAVEPPPAPSTTYVMVPDPAAKDDKAFHENVKDAFFDVGSASLRPDTHASIKHAATYLLAHPTIHVIISGWADPRGSVQYNLKLGIKRANAVRDALIAASVPADQLEVISNGKSSQVCTTSDQQCLQQNRRVAFIMRP